MAKCTVCKREMRDPTTTSCLYDVIEVDNGEEYYERSRFHFDEPNGRCSDCGIKHGGIHHFGCDVERCPKCGYQLISCSCFTEDNLVLVLSQKVEPEKIKKPVEPPSFSSTH